MCGLRTPAKFSLKTNLFSFYLFFTVFYCKYYTIPCYSCNHFNIDVILLWVHSLCYISNPPCSLIYLITCKVICAKKNLQNTIRVTATCSPLQVLAPAPSVSQWHCSLSLSLPQGTFLQTGPELSGFYRFSNRHPLHRCFVDFSPWHWTLPYLTLPYLELPYFT